MFQKSEPGPVGTNSKEAVFSALKAVLWQLEQPSNRLPSDLAKSMLTDQTR